MSAAEESSTLEGTPRSVMPAEVNEVVSFFREKSTVIIDCRTAEESAAPPFLSILPSHKLLNVSVDLKSELPSPFTEEFLAVNGVSKAKTTIVVFCRTGKRSEVAFNALRDLGCLHVARGIDIHNVRAKMQVATDVPVPCTSALSMLKQKRVVLLDVRRPDEFAVPPFVDVRGTGFKVVNASCTLTDCSAMNEEFLEEHKIDKKATNILVYCRSGRRAGVALDVLEQLGCERVLNGMAVEDVVSALLELQGLSQDQFEHCP